MRICLISKQQSGATPVELDKSVGLGIAVPSVVEYHNEVYVFYNNGVPEGGAPGALGAAIPG